MKWQRRPRSGGELLELYRRLLRVYGPQGWWPGDGPFEVMVGAVLVQGTHWRNASRAVQRLREAGLLEPRRLAELPATPLATLVRSSGYYRVKARRLQALCRWIVAAGGLERLARRSTEALRTELLAVPGVGPETADAILLYAFDRPVCVVDAYTRRLFARYGLPAAGAGDEALRCFVLEQFGTDVAVLNELHALIVAHGKAVCAREPNCTACVLSRRCRLGRARSRQLTDSRTVGR